MSEVEISDNEQKKRDWRTKLDGITREISDNRHSKNAIEYAIDLMDSHRNQLERKISELTKIREEMLDAGW